MEIRADCLAFIVFRSFVTVYIFIGLILTMPWVGLQFVIVVFPDRTLTFFVYSLKCSILSFHAVFAFQNCILLCAETKGQTNFQEN